jgi:hypothetical protein
VVADDEEHRDEHRDADRRPDELPWRLSRRHGPAQLHGPLRCREVEAADDDEAEPVQQGDAREDERVGVRRGHPHDEVGDEEQPAQTEPVAERARGHPAVDGETDCGVGEHGDEDGEGREDELRAATAGRGRRRGCRGSRLAHEAPAGHSGSRAFGTEVPLGAGVAVAPGEGEAFGPGVGTGVGTGVGRVVGTSSAGVHSG